MIKIYLTDRLFGTNLRYAVILLHSNLITKYSFTNEF